MKRLIAALLFLALASEMAVAHTGIGSTSAFSAGIAHPLGGFDHLLAMVAVGLWAGLKAFSIEAGPGSHEENTSVKTLGVHKALWLWPLCFVGAMVLGGALGLEGVPLPFVEQGILVSILVLGLAVAFAFDAPIVVGGLIIAAAGILHGHAHGVEAPLDASGLHYALGFVLATAALHAIGAGMSIMALKLRLPMAIRGAGAATAVAGLALVFLGAGA